MTGHQWWWEADYLGSGVVTANEIHIPIGRPLLVDVDSVDVIHDFWVPELARKIDTIPGHPNDIWLRPTCPASTSEPAREFCGNQHAWMRIRRHRANARGLRGMAARSTAWCPRPHRRRRAVGAKVFRDQTCNNCH